MQTLKITHSLLHIKKKQNQRGTKLHITQGGHSASEHFIIKYFRLTETKDENGL